MLRAKVHGPPIALGKFCFERHLPAQAAFVQRHARNYSVLQLLTNREKLVLGRLIKNVVDHLYHIHQASAQGLESIFGLPAIEAEAEVANDSITPELLDRIAKFRLVGPAVVPDMELQQIDGVDSKLSADQVGVLENVVRRKN